MNQTFIMRLAGVLILVATAAFADRTVYIDPVSANGPASWNNVSFATSNATAVLTDSLSTWTGIRLTVTVPLQGPNSNASATPTGDAAEFAPAGANSAYGNTNTFGGKIVLFGETVFSNLAPATAYTFTFYASRTGVGDNRETLYALTGANSGSNTLDAANNSNQVAVVSNIFPLADGTVTLRIERGANNNEPTGFFYLTAMKLSFEQSFADIAAQGDTIVSNATSFVRINSDGTSGPIELSETNTVIQSLTQNTGTNAEVNTADKILRVSSVEVLSGKGALTLGLAPNHGTLSAAAEGGGLSLANSGASALTVNAVIADYGAAASLTKSGAGSVVLAGANTFSGAVTIQQDSLTLSNRYALQNALLTTSGVVFDSSVAEHAFTIGNLTNAFALSLADNAANPVALSVGNNNASSSFGGVLSGAGSLVKVGSGTLALTAATSTYSGGTTISDGALTTGPLGAAGGLGTGPVTNNATLNLTGGGVTYTGLSSAMSGTGTVNVTLSTGTGNSTPLNGDYAGFTGTWNLGVGAPVTGSGKALMTGADNAAATINVLSNATLVVNAAGTHQAAAVLNGGNTGESNGQLRLDSGAVWAGPVTLAGNITDAADGLIGGISGIGTISGLISDLGGPYALDKVGSGVIIFSGITNTYAGQTWVRQGTLGVAALKNAGVASSLGQPAGGDSVIKLGNGSTAARLAYYGSGDTTDRAIDMAGTTGTAYLEQAGSGLLTFTGDLTYSGAGSKVLTLHGATDGVGELAGVFADGPSYTNRLIKADTGKWILSNANTYSGETDIQNGTLALAHPNAIPATSLVRFTTTRKGVLEFSNDGAGESEINITIGQNIDGTLASGVGTGSAGVNHTVNNVSMSQCTLTVCRAASVLSGTPTVSVRNLFLSGGNTYTTALNPTNADLIIGSASVSGNSYVKTLRLDGTSAGNMITGTIFNGVNTLVLNKANTSTWTLSGSNTYGGSTTVNGGLLVLAGTEGGIASSSGLTLNSGGTLRLANSAATNHPNRLRDAAPVTLAGGTLDYAHAGGVADYVETVGAVTVSGAGSAISAAQADAGQSSTLTLSSLTRSANATLDFSGSGLGTDTRNRILISGQPAGLIGLWASYGNSGLAAYDSTLGVYAGSTSTSELAAKGPTSTIPDDALALARITTAGSSGPITLSGATVNSVAALIQSTNTAAEVDAAGKTLRTHALAIDAGQEALTIGTSEGSGTLTALAPGGKLELVNESTQPMIINAALADNASASSLVKNGTGDVILKGLTAYTGPTAINAGSLTFGGHVFTQSVAGVISGGGTLVKSGTNLLHLLVSNTYTGPTYINAGIVRPNGNSAFGSNVGGVFIAAGAVLDVGCSADVGGTRGTDGLDLGSEVFTVSGAGADGSGAIVNNSAVSQNKAFGKVTLADHATFGGTARFDLRQNTPTLTMNGFTLTKKGSNTFGLTSANVLPGEGHIDVQSGVLKIESNARLNGSETNTLTLRTNATLDLYKLYPQNAPLWSLLVEDQATLNVSSGGTALSNNWAGPVTLNGALRLTGGSYHHAFHGTISGPGSIVKYGTTTAYLTNDFNTYGGFTWITNGTLVFSSVRNLGQASSLGAPATAGNGLIRLGGGATAAALIYTGTGNTTDRNLELAGTTGGATLTHAGSGPLEITGTVTASGAGAKTLTLICPTNASVTFAGAVTDLEGSKTSLTKNGAGAWTLSGNNAYTGDVTVAAGTLTLSGANAQGQGSIVVGSAAADATLRLDPGCLLTSTGFAKKAGGIMVGNVVGAHGALYMSAGATVSRSPGTGDDQAFTIGKVAGSYGYFKMSGGEMTITRIQTGYSGTTTSNTVGNFRMTGGTLNLTNYILIARGKGSESAFTVDGGTIIHTNASDNLSIGYEGGRGELNLTGGTLESFGKPLTVRQSANNTTGIVNLCAGSLSVDTFQNTAPGVALLNFAGGTLKAGNVNSSVFIPTSINGVYSYGPFGAYAGGAAIDTGVRSVTLAAPLQAPAGSGVYAVTLADQGSGYIGEPYVAVTGPDGVGATAVAEMEDDGTGNGTYRVASVRVTSPGVSYVTPPTLIFKGGGTAAVPPAVASVTLAPNASGGLTKLGSGVLTLGGLNTYGGATTVSNGTLKLGVAKALPTGTSVVLAGGTLDLSGYTVTNTVSGSGVISNGTVQAVLSPAGEGAVGADTLTLKSATLQGLYRADVTAAGASDSVAVQGNINLSGLELQIVNLANLDRQHTYTILTCTGTRSGTFSATNLPPGSHWHLIYRADGAVQLFYDKGTLIRIM